MDYKLLYEQALAAHQKVVAEKDEQTQALNFELDKYKRYIFGKKNEKLAGVHTDVNQIDLFELGTTQQQQEPDTLRGRLLLNHSLFHRPRNSPSYPGNGPSS